jgi:hypothetical protein
MNRPLALYLLILNFFLILIGGSELALVHNRDVIWRVDFLLALGAMFVCAIASVLYIYHTRNSFSSPEPESIENVIDDLPRSEQPRFIPLPDWIKVCGVVASLLAILVFGETAYGLYILYKEGLLGAEFRSNSSLGVVFAVLLFNALCQPWYVWRTFLNVNNS